MQAEILFQIAGPLFAVSLAGESFLGAPLFPWFEVKRMPLDFLYDVFLLYLTLEAT